MCAISAVTMQRDLHPETYEKAKGIVFSEPMADVCYDEDFPRPEGAHTILAVEPLPGQFDQRADSCARVHPAAHRRRTPDRCRC